MQQEGAEVMILTVMRSPAYIDRGSRVFSPARATHNEHSRSPSARLLRHEPPLEGRVAPQVRTEETSHREGGGPPPVASGGSSKPYTCQDLGKQPAASNQPPVTRTVLSVGQRGTEARGPRAEAEG